MPNMDGLQLLGEMKANANYEDVQVLMITTEGAQAKVLEAVNSARWAMSASRSRPIRLRRNSSACFRAAVRLLNKPR